MMRMKRRATKPRMEKFVRAEIIIKHSSRTVSYIFLLVCSALVSECCPFTFPLRVLRYSFLSVGTKIMKQTDHV
jgi:hypothetical protein